MKGLDGRCYATHDACMADYALVFARRHPEHGGTATCEAQTSAFCKFRSYTGGPKEYFCSTSMEGCMQPGDDCREYTSFPTATATVYEKGQDPNDCANYEKLSIIAVKNFPPSDADWSDEDIRAFDTDCPRYESASTLVWAIHGMLPNEVALHPNEACVAPYLKRGQAACAASAPQAKRARARLEADRSRRAAAAAQQDAQRRATATAGAYRDCVDAAMRPGGLDLAGRCTEARASCTHCCHVRNASATEEHCNAICGDNMSAYRCSP